MTQEQCYGENRDIVESCAAQDRRARIGEELACQACIGFVERAAYTDITLTELPNRLAAQSEFKRLKQSGDDIGVILFDINNFGRTNQISHDFGDAILIMTGRFLAGVQKREQDVVSLSRYGGDEFLALTRLHNRPGEQTDPLEQLHRFSERVNTEFRRLESIKSYNKGLDPKNQLRITFNTTINTADDNASFKDVMKQIGPKSGFQKLPDIVEPRTWDASGAFGWAVATFNRYIMR